jgi:hypothetical protein
VRGLLPGTKNYLLPGTVRVAVQFGRYQVQVHHDSFLLQKGRYVLIPLPVLVLLVVVVFNET